MLLAPDAALCMYHCYAALGEVGLEAVDVSTTGSVNDTTVLPRHRRPGRVIDSLTLPKFELERSVYIDTG